jgi:hypothetical protein
MSESEAGDQKIFISGYWATDSYYYESDLYKPLLRLDGLWKAKCKQLNYSVSCALALESFMEQDAPSMNFDTLSRFLLHLATTKALRDPHLAYSAALMLLPKKLRQEVQTRVLDFHYYDQDFHFRDGRELNQGQKEIIQMVILLYPFSVERKKIRVVALRWLCGFWVYHILRWRYDISPKSIIQVRQNEHNNVLTGEADGMFRVAAQGS